MSKNSVRGGNLSVDLADLSACVCCESGEMTTSSMSAGPGRRMSMLPSSTSAAWQSSAGMASSVRRSDDVNFSRLGSIVRTPAAARHTATSLN